MVILKAYKLKVNKEEQSLLEQCAGCARFAYNWGLARRIAEYEATGKSSNIGSTAS